jgi:hypothetical protein
MAVETGDDLPGLQLRVHNGLEQCQNFVIGPAAAAEVRSGCDQRQTVDACFPLSHEMQAAVERN